MKSAGTRLILRLGLAALRGLRVAMGRCCVAAQRLVGYALRANPPYIDPSYGLLDWPLMLPCVTCLVTIEIRQTDALGSQR